MSIEVWATCWERSLTEKEMEVLARQLPVFRQTRLRSLQRKEKRQEVICAYLLLHKALQNCCQWKVWPEIAFGDGGKPWFPSYPNIQFNLSHTAGAAAVAVSAMAVGIDIEKIRPLHRQTISHLDGLCTEQDFFRSWVRKEAVAKCRGTGVAGMLRTEPELKKDERYYELELFSDYSAGIAFQGGDTDIMIERVSLEELIKSERLG